jgi:protein-S-isoprenylcysteine O-methyltransferase Ste14
LKIFLLILSAILAVFGLVHLPLLLKSQRNRQSKFNLGDPTYWAMMIAFALVLAAIGAEVAVRLPDQLAWWTWPGRVLVALAAFWTLWTRRVLGNSYAPTAENFDPGQTRVKTGPYRWLKHPMYLGNIATVVGALLAFNLMYAWGSLVPFIGAIGWRIAAENRFMAEKFGKPEEER